MITGRKYTSKRVVLQAQESGFLLIFGKMCTMTMKSEKVILITGITSGFGKAMAERFSREGYKVYGTHRNAREFIPGITYIKADVCNEQECRAAVEQVIAREGKIDIFINNAGMGVGGPLEFTSMQDAQQQMDTNFMGMVRFIHYVLPAMRERGEGTIMCLSSIGGLVGLPYQGLYSASKFAIEGYCEALRLEVRRFGVKVIVIEPGDFSTAFTAQRRCVEAPEAYEVYKTYAKSLAGIEHDENTGLKPDYLAKRVSKILEKRHPAHSYVISTFLQWLATFAKRVLPSKAFAWIMSLYYGV